jgi:sulfite oxidase
MPLDEMVKEDNEVLLATHMNGKPLPRDHGAPVRLLIPGVVGCRSVKWLNKIVLRNDAGDSPWTQHFYRHEGKPIVHWPVQSMITFVQGLPASELPVGPAPATRRELAVTKDGLHLSGFAYAGGGRSVDRVEVSADGGSSWQDAVLCKSVTRPSGKQWAWTLWEATLPVPAGVTNGGTVSLCCRAWDSEMQAQPLTPSDALSNTPSGYLFNPVHHISATVITKGNPDHITAGIH